MTILVGDAVDMLRTMPNGSAHCCVTSPPYWGLRDYGMTGQIGLEETPDAYVTKLVEVFREVRRVLRDDGTLWLNLGDSYNGSRSGPQGQTGEMADRRVSSQRCREFGSTRDAGLKPKDLVGIPWRVAFALQADGWFLRSDIVWSKPNPMPESVTDRPTKSHEYLFLLAKSGRYFYDAEAVAEPCGEKPSGNATRRFADGSPGQRPNDHLGSAFPWQPNGRRNLGSAFPWQPNGRRNRRSVWTIATKPFTGAHFATFPEELPRLCILAGTSERGACASCGSPWRRVLDRERTVDGEAADLPRMKSLDSAAPSQAQGIGHGRIATRVKTTGWSASCACEAPPPRACVVLDPFCGSGTTGVAAESQQRRFIGIELNAEYAAIAQGRLDRDGAPLLARGAIADGVAS